ncbi:aminoglycoside phosphotransferase family protein [Blastococcus sp. PRF04-17]|uniref:aminoglycoside phosphotransferase family protein n=1 Tax=Blastococcus sp. PRF04-17 TaxID=2933797 RepID=UPI001FF4559F|nr:aminoglycoside phosphotransferase family protein [Blastococcus sp. PRF04-17]UOY03603.1 aminoglycoside phosphotransferase family protein [Blastococcus sp. PRF04-17]
MTVQPDGAATVQYSADVSWRNGRRTREALSATTGTRIPPGAAVVEGDTGAGPVTVALWRWPLDPALPGLAWAASADGVARRLTELGLGSGPPRLRLRSYRPGRRAVIEAVTPEGTLFLKVVRPAATERLVARHALLVGAVPVPPVLAATPDGVVVLPGLHGAPMRTLLSGTAGPLPEAAELDRVLDALPAAVADLAPAGRSMPGDGLARADDHARVLGTVLGSLRPRLDDLTARLAGSDPAAYEAVAVHGDFYESQLLLDGGRVVGVLDVDTAGRGHRIDDWATLLAHVAVLEQVLPDPSRARRYAGRLEEEALRRWPASHLRPRVSAVLLGLATGPFRVQQAGWPERTAERLTLAEQWAR